MSSSLRASSDSSAPSPTAAGGWPARRPAARPARRRQRPVVGVHTGPGQQLGDDLLVHVGVLPQVQTGQVKPEDVHGFPQPARRSSASTARCRWRAARRRRCRDRPAARPVSHSAAARDRARVRAGGRGFPSGRRGQPSVDHPQCAPVRFVGAGRLIAFVGQCGELVADLDQPRRHRQFLLQRGDFGEVMLQRGVRGAAGGQPHHIGGDVGIAVAVAADPRPGPQDRLVQQVRIGPAGLQAVRTSALTCGMTSKNAAG